MHLRRLMLLLLAVGMTLSCGLPFAAAPTPAPATLPPAAPPTDTVPPAPADTATPEFTATPGVPMVTPAKDPVNCRFGPSTGYEAQGGGLLVGASTQILGRTADNAWWQIQDPSAPNLKCWVAASVTVTSGNLGGIPVLPAPAAFVTDVKVSVDPHQINIGGCMGPLMQSTLKGTIHTNGPAVVEWHFETEQGGALPVHSITFTKFGSQDVSGEFTPAAAEGKYWVRLVVTSPGSLLDEDNYSIDC